jgi:hypothetical protein
LAIKYDHGLFYHLNYTNMRKRFSRITGLFFLLVIVSMTACKKDDYRQPLPQITGKYENGIILVNEGWFGHDNGNVNFYRYGRDTVEQMIYHKENPGKDLGTTTQYGAVHNGKLYLVSKQGPLVVTDAKSLIETGRITTMPANGRAFIGLNNTDGLISTSDGIYRLNLSTLAVGAKIAGITGELPLCIESGSGPRDP